MPKDPARNVDRYKIRGGHFNEFDFIRHHTELSQEQGERPEQGSQLPFPSEQKKVERIKELLAQYGESGEQKTDREGDQDNQEDTRRDESIEDTRIDEPGAHPTIDATPEEQLPSPVKKRRTDNKKSSQTKAKTATKAKTTRKASTQSNRSKSKSTSRPTAKSSSRLAAKPAKRTTKATKKPATRKRSATTTGRNRSASRKPMRNK